MRASATRRTSFSLVAAVADEVGDRDEQQVVLGRERLQLGHARHRAVVVHDLAEHAGGVQPGHAGQVDRGLGVTGPLEHAALAVAQREDVTGPGEVVGPGGGVEDGVHGGGRGRRRRCRWWCRGGRRPRR